MLKQAVVEGFNTDDTIAVDATLIEAREQAQPNKKKPLPKEHGRKLNHDREV